MRDEKQSTRRSVLKKAGISFATVGALPTVASSREKRSDFQRKIQNSLRVKEGTGSVERWHQFLRNQGMSVGSVNYRYEMPTGTAESSDDVSTQHWANTTDLDITLSLTHDCGSEYYADLSWSYVEDGSWTHDSDGDPPLDISGISYNANWWDLRSTYIPDTTEMSQYVSYRDGTNGGDGLGFEVDDDAISWNSADSDVHYSGIYIEPINDYDSSVREVYGRYCHTWNSGDLKSVTVGYSDGGVVFKVETSIDTEQWVTDTEQDGQTLLEVAQADAGGNGGWECQ